MPLIATIGEASSVLGEVRKVEDFFKLSDKTDHFYDSPVFSFADTQWFMRMYPNGEKRGETSGWMALYLMRKESGPPKPLICTFGLKGSNGVEKNVPVELQWDFSSETDLGYGFRRAWSRSDLSNRKGLLLPNNVMTVTCDLRSNALSTVKSEKKVLKSLRNVLESGADSDVIMKVQGKEFPAHKVILRARSSVFRSMFEHDMVEKQTNVVSIEDCDPETFCVFLIHVYSGNCNISTKNVFNLFMTADKYDIDELKSACKDFMMEYLSVDCFCDVIALALRHSEQKLIERATDFFCNNSLEIVKTVKWHSFLKENLTAGNELIIKTLSK